MLRANVNAIWFAKLPEPEILILLSVTVRATTLAYLVTPEILQLAIAPVESLAYMPL